MKNSPKFALKSSSVFKVPALTHAIWFICQAGAMQAHGAIVSNQIDYQLFRDFAENKGRFTPNATNIAITNKQGENLGQVLPVPMPDMRATSVNLGVATLIDVQHVTTAQHNKNRSLEKIQFGNNSGRFYSIVFRNDAESERGLSYEQIQNFYDNFYGNKGDYRDYREYNDIAMPRLDKMVAEVTPMRHFDSQNGSEVFNVHDYRVFARTGSGTQGIAHGNGNNLNSVKDSTIKVKDAYKYLIGGSIVSLQNELVKTKKGHGHYIKTNEFNFRKLTDGKTRTGRPLGESPLVAAPQKGDSGSPLYGFHRKRQQ